MRLLLDTQILVWMITGDRRLTKAWRDAIAGPDAELQVSAVVAVEFTELQMRQRLPVDETIAELVDRFELGVAALPAECWEIVRGLPPIHRDPVDRMLVAHALAAGMSLITADTQIQRYPVTCL